jgi:hypothetical protein
MSLPVALSEQVLTPAAVFLLGYAVKLSFSTALGWWLMACGISLFILARFEYRRFWHNQRIVTDAMLHGKRDEERIKRYERGGRKDADNEPDEAELK